MKHKSRIFALLMALTFVSFVPNAFAQNQRHKRGKRIIQALELTETQQQKARSLRAEMREDLSPVKQDLREKREQMQGLWSAPQPNRQAILNLKSQMDTLRQVVRDRRREFRDDLRSILNDQQKARFDQLGPRHRHRFHHGKRGQRGQRGQKIAQQLGLNQGQVTQFRSLKQNMREQVRPIKQNIRQLRQQLDQATDAQTIRDLRAQIDSLRGQVYEHKVDFRIAVLQILTPEQRQRFLELRQQRRRGPRM